MTTETTETIGQAALADLVGERRRQIDHFGYDPAHDDFCHGDGQLALAAAVLATPVALYERVGRPDGVAFVDPWPWEVDFDPRRGAGGLRRDHAQQGDDRRRLLVKAGALLLAEVERLDRAAAADRLAGQLTFWEGCDWTVAIGAHHDPAVFVAALARAGFADLSDHEPGDVQHGYARQLTAPELPDGWPVDDPCFRVCAADAPGAVAITYVD